jgi:hypothetical protein
MRARTATMTMAAVAVAAAGIVACVGTTGGELVDFPAAAAGSEDVTSPLAFDTDYAGHAWHVVLTQATLHIGALYLDQSSPVSGAQGTTCILPGTYTAEVLGTPANGGASGLDVDLLSPAPQHFPSPGHGTTLTPLVGQVWLTGGDVNTIADPTSILVVAGTASDDVGASYPFTGTITIGSNRQATSSNPAGANPICKQRIVSPIPLSAGVGVQPTGGLLLRMDPRRLFVNVDFSKLPQAPGGGGTYEFSDAPGTPEYGQPSVNLYLNLHASALYAFSWSAAL